MYCYSTTHDKPCAKLTEITVLIFPGVTLCTQCDEYVLKFVFEARQHSEI